MPEDTNYSLDAEKEIVEFPAPDLDYKPPQPKDYRPRIGLIGCGGISPYHLKAYRQTGLEVVGLCDLNPEAARERQEAFYPEAVCHGDFRDLLSDETIEVVDIALHPGPRAAVIEAALKAGKHVLSQKPFALDLEVAERLTQLAEQLDLRLAVNQNGRWAPYLRYIQQAIDSGLIGHIHTVNLHLNWDHTWIRGTPFETIHHIILYDFAVHWIDATVNFFKGQKAELALGTVRAASDQTINPPMMGGAVIQFSKGFATLGFDGHSKQGALERITVTGSKGVLTASGEVCKVSEVILETDKGKATAQLEGQWFEEGFQGTMGELICAIEEVRQPFNSARNNLDTLATLFAVIGSADRGHAMKVGRYRQLGDNCIAHETGERGTADDAD